MQTNRAYRASQVLVAQSLHLVDLHHEDAVPLGVLCRSRRSGNTEAHAEGLYVLFMRGVDKRWNPRQQVAAAGRQAVRLSGWQAGQQAGMHTFRQAGRPAVRWLHMYRGWGLLQMTVACQA